MMLTRAAGMRSLFYSSQCAINHTHIPAVYQQKGQWGSSDPAPGQGCHSTTEETEECVRALVCRVLQLRFTLGKRCCRWITYVCINVFCILQCVFVFGLCGLTECVLRAAMILDSANSQSSSTYARLTKPWVVWRTWSSTTKKLGGGKNGKTENEKKDKKDIRA